MLAKEKPEVVFIVTSYGPGAKPLYPALAMDCMKAGAHAWIEKPPAGSSKEIATMMRISQETGKQVGVGFKKMFFTAHQKAHTLINRPEFGRITSITASYPEWLPPLRERENPEKMVLFLDHFVHPHSLLRLLGGPLDWIFVNRCETNGAASVSLRFKSGAVGNLLFSAGQSECSYRERIEVIGEGENVVIENGLRVIHYPKVNRQEEYGRSGDYYELFKDAPRCWEPEFSLGELHNKGLFLLGYAPEVIHFTTRLLKGQAPLWGNLDDALELLKIYEAYLQADATIVPVG